MGKKSFFYQSPKIFNIGLKLIHGKNLDKRYEYISEQIGEEKSILEPACGTAQLANYIHLNNIYKGFDTNEIFIKYGQERGLDVSLGDATDKESYTASDIVVLSDSVHHLGRENENVVLENSLESAREKIIICDPFKDYYLKMLPKWILGSEKILEKWYDYIEKDGNNNASLKNTRTKKELLEVMVEGFGVIPKKTRRKLKEIGEDLIVTYYL